MCLTDLRNLNPDWVGKYLAFLAPESLPAPVWVTCFVVSTHPAIQEEWDLSSMAQMGESLILQFSLVTSVVSFYPQASNTLESVSFIFLSRMTISHSLALKRANWEIIFSTDLSFFHCVCLSHQKSSDTYCKFKNDLLIQKKRSGSDELRLVMNSNCWSWFMGPGTLSITFSLFLCMF